MDEETVHTIMFWVEPSKTSEVYRKVCEAIKEYEPHIKFHAVAPFLVKCERLAAEATKEAIEKVLYNYFPLGEALRVEHATQEILKALGELGFTFKEGM